MLFIHEAAGTGMPPIGGDQCAAVGVSVIEGENGLELVRHLTDALRFVLVSIAPLDESDFRAVGPRKTRVWRAPSTGLNASVTS